MNASDNDVRAEISRLVDEEHELRQGSADETSRARLRELEESLDRCWDLLRQRQALREASLDPDQAATRPASEVEGYLQ